MKVKTEKLSKVQILSVVGAILGMAFAAASMYVPEIMLFGDVMYNFLIATGVEGLCALAGTFKGYRKMTEEEIAKLKEKQLSKDAAPNKKAIKAKFKELQKAQEAKLLAEAEAKVVAETKVKNIKM